MYIFFRRWSSFILFVISLRIFVMVVYSLLFKTMTQFQIRKVIAYIIFHVSITQASSSRYHSNQPKQEQQKIGELKTKELFCENATGNQIQIQYGNLI